MKGGNRRFGYTLAGLVVLACTGGAFIYLRATAGLTAPADSAAKMQPAAKKEPASVSCLGHIEPKDGAVSISARALSGQPSIVADLKVHEGDWVKPGQVIAVLDSHRQLEEAARSLNAQVAVAQRRLEIAKTGAPRSDLAAQQAEIARLEASLSGARINADRIAALYDKQAATVTERDQSRLQVETTTQSLNAARSRLQSLEQEVRDVDVKLAEANVQAAQSSVARAQVDVEPSIVHALSGGRVLKVYAHAGEEVGPKGILELGRTDQMYAIAEVVESDVRRVRIGGKATVTSEALAQAMGGVVESIGTQVTKGDLSPTDPASFSDARVVEVKIRLDDSTAASSLIHGKVVVVLEP